MQPIQNIEITARKYTFGTKTERKLKIFRSMNYKFTPHNYVRKKDGKAVLYLELSQDGKRHKELLENILINPLKWNNRKQRLSTKKVEEIEVNSLLDEIEQRILSIKNKYIRDGKVLTIPQFIEEYTNYNSFIDFVAFMNRELEAEKAILKPGTYRYIKSIADKLHDWKHVIPFAIINDEFFREYRKYCYSRDNNDNTINRNIRVIKTYLKKAKKKEIKFDLDLDDVKTKTIQTERKELTILEIRKFIELFYSDKLTNSQHHSLGLFLFSCLTGLRYSDLQNFNLNKISDDVIILRMEKSDKPIRIPLTPGAKRIAFSINWDKKITYQNNLKFLKEAVKKSTVRKKVSYHIARHSFATNYIRTNGSVAKLQKLLGHKSIKTTMLYVHITENENDQHIYKLDDIINHKY